MRKAVPTYSTFRRMSNVTLVRDEPVTFGHPAKPLKHGGILANTVVAVCDTALITLASH